MTLISVVVPLLVLGGAASAGMLLLVLWRRPVSLGGPEVVGFLGLSLGATLWSWSYALQLRASTLPVILAFNDLLWLGTGLVGASWPVFAFAVAGDDRWLTRRRIPVVSGVPLAFALLAVSNPAHKLIYADVTLTTGEVVRSTVTPGIGFGLFLLWSFAVNTYVLWRLARSWRRSTGVTRSRRLAVFGAGLLPMIAGVASIAARPASGPPIDFTPVLFSVTTVLTGVAITRYRLLDSIAVAQDHIVAHLSDPVVIVDGDGTVRAANAAAARLFADRDPIGRPVKKVFRSQPDLVEVVRRCPGRGTDDVTVALDVDEPARSVGSSGSDDATTEPARGTPTGADDASASVRRTFTTSVGSLEGTNATVLVFRDITERRAAERRVEVLNRVLRHDLRNDISVIDGYLRLLREELDEDASPAVRDALDVLSARTDGMIEVTEQAALAETLADGEPAVRRFDLATVVRQRVEQVRAEHPEVRLDVRIPESPVTIAAVSVFPSAVDNLIENAIEHADADSPFLDVRVEVADDGSTVDLRVADDGPGLSAVDRAVLVGDERSLDEANGLGLWLISRIVEASGGSVTVDDTDRGTTVVVRFPVVDSAADSPRQRPSTPNV
ncbi:sensor histidine kinase [Halobaculum gomorrense]|uniref:histidine kinase n=1 Tax=Halobaculum gomorrense TaxID=43928 RepID=A0A1M5MI43_9EURY|nr:histidine kinase N-terminal 7TM domain-containing protein [Halobaculum gomorrense]SHG77094.1 Signal transduction histidine kinase [Halobaculum gomorrense]